MKFTIEHKGKVIHVEKPKKVIKPVNIVNTPYTDKDAIDYVGSRIKGDGMANVSYDGNSITVSVKEYKLPEYSKVAHTGSYKDLSDLPEPLVLPDFTAIKEEAKKEATEQAVKLVDGVYMPKQGFSKLLMEHLSGHGDTIVTYDKKKDKVKVTTYVSPVQTSTGGAVSVDGVTITGDGTPGNPLVSVGGSAAWGTITGTISNQTDLQTAFNAKANLSGATFTGDISVGSNKVTGAAIQANSSAGGEIRTSSGAVAASWGSGGGANGTLYGGWNYDNATASTIAGFGASKTIESLSTATYPSLTELSYVKGVTSAIQTQINTRNAVLNMNTTQVGNVGAGVQDLMTYTLPANTLNSDGRGIKITAWGNRTNNANVKTLTLNFGSLVLATRALSTGTNTGWVLEAYVIRTGSNAQDWVVHNIKDNVANVAAVMGTATQTDTADIIVKCTGSATANNDIVQQGMIIERIN